MESDKLQGQIQDTSESSSNNMNCFKIFNACKTLKLMITALLLLTVGIVLLLLSKPIIRYGINKNARLIPGKESYNNWLSTPVPVYREIYLWNVTNADEVVATGAQPELQEVGPFTYREIMQKVNVTNAYDSRITYSQRKYYVFDANRSVSDDTVLITSLNIPLVAIIEQVQYMSAPKKMIVKFLLRGQTLFIRKSVNKLLWGYHDKVLQALANRQEFGIFVKPNGNGSADGEYEIYDGTSNIQQLGEIYAWNTSRKLNFWNTDACNQINGTDGSIFSPELRRSMYVFSTDVCRSIHIDYQHTSKVKGITSHVYVPPVDLFSEVTATDRRNAGFCTPNCLHAGALNVSVCKGAPIIMSQPHFYLAPFYENKVKGLTPDKLKHETIFHLEPVSKTNTGTILKVNKRLQINVYYNRSDLHRDMKNASFTVMPITWINEYAEISDTLVDEMNTKLFKVKKALLIVSLTIIVIMSLLFIFTLVRCVLNTFRNKDYSTIPSSTETS